MRLIGFQSKTITEIINNRFAVIGRIEHHNGYSFEIIIYKEYTLSGGEIHLPGFRTLREAEFELTSEFLIDKIKA